MRKLMVLLCIAFLFTNCNVTQLTTGATPAGYSNFYESVRRFEKQRKAEKRQQNKLRNRIRQLQEIDVYRLY